MFRWTRNRKLALPFPQLFRDAIKLAMSYKQNSNDFMDEVMRELEVIYPKSFFVTAGADWFNLQQNN